MADFAYTDLPTIIHSRGWESLCDFPITFLSVLILECYSNMHGFDFLVPLFSTRVRGTRIVVTSQLVADVLHILRVEHPDYLGCEHLRTMSKDEMISTFCECPADWGDRQCTPCQPFAKGPTFINMVMTFVLHPLSHYNSITEPRARFLLSLLEHLTIDFPSHFILFILDVYRDIATMRILCHFSVPFPSFDHFPIMCAIDYATVKRRKVQFRSR